MEIQIRTVEMDLLAVGGTASHSLYKGGLADPDEVCALFMQSGSGLFSTSFIKPTPPPPSEKSLEMKTGYLPINKPELHPIMLMSFKHM
jgi:hypothetical protein